MFDLSYTTDLKKGLVKTPLASVFALGDKNAHTLRVTLMNGSEKQILDGQTISGYCIRYRDNATVNLRGHIENGQAVVTMSPGCYAQKGLFAIAILVGAGSADETTVFIGEGTVTQTNTDTIVDEEKVIPSVAELLAMIDTLKKAVAEAQTATTAANTAAAAANESARNAGNAAASANEAASTANTAAERAGTAAAAIEGMTVSAEDVGPDEAADVEISDVDGVKHIAFKLRQGKTGDTGATPDITFNVQTGAPGTDVQVSQSGTPEAPVVELTIPRGIPGEGAVSTVNGIQPDENGNVELGDIGAVKTVDGVEPDEAGNVVLNAVKVGDVVEQARKAEDSNKLGGVEASSYALKAPNNYAYDGVDLSTVFASAEELHAAVAAGDFSKIRVGDYWPITLNGSYTDLGDDTTKTLANAVVKMEVAGIDTYINYGDTAITAHHLVMCSRDLLPNRTKWRKENTAWHDTSANNPWRGSAIYATLNVGILPLVQKTDIGAYIFAGPNGNGMSFLGETKAASATAATNWGWLDRGRLFLPTEREIWGQGVWSELTYGAGLALQWPLFAGSLRHVVKGLGNGGSRYHWWLSSSYAGSASYACTVDSNGYATSPSASNAFGLALCFLLA